MISTAAWQEKSVDRGNGKLDFQGKIFEKDKKNLVTIIITKRCSCFKNHF